MRNHIVWLALCTSCVAPGDKFDEFVDKKRDMEAENQPDPPPEQSGGALTPEQISGFYLYVVSTSIARSQPVVYLLEAEASAIEGSDEISLRLRERPLACVDRRTPVAEFGEWRNNVVNAEGMYMTDVIQTFVPAAANAALSCGADGMTNVTFSGTIFAPEEEGAPVEFWCGTMSGSAGVIALDGSTFTATRISDPDDYDSYPEVVINCAKDEAGPIL